MSTNNIGGMKDSAATETTGAWSVISILKGILSGVSLKLGGSVVSSSNPLPAKSVNCVIASDGVLLPVESLEQTLTYTGDLISTISVSFGSEVYIQTYTYTSSNVTSISQWEKQ